MLSRFPETLWIKLLEDIDDSVKIHPKPHLAVFDADGTLWPQDAGEEFLRFQHEQGLLKNLPSDPIAHYRKLLKKDVNTGLVWLAQVNKGLTVQEVRQMASEWHNSQRHTAWAYEDQKILIEELKKRDITPYIVSGSIKWALEPLAISVGISPEHVVAVETEVHDGVITANPIEPVTFFYGKVEAFLKASDGSSPIFACGNSMGDYDLIQTSKAIKFAVSGADPTDAFFEGEKKLAEKAEELDWYYHRFWSEDKR
jgi:phosphoserine phosphatase